MSGPALHAKTATFMRFMPENLILDDASVYHRKNTVVWDFTFRAMHP